MKRIIDGENSVMGRLAAVVAKNALKGDEIVILNCDKVNITGNRKRILEDFREKRKKIGSGQKGPKYSRLSERIVKRAIRGMIPNHRRGRGKEAFGRIKCFSGIPKEFEGKKMEKFEGKEKRKYIKVKEVSEQ
ncbi:50S ribosomal protein L13 [Candidatus Pacearchaeota archaeon CG10_big_fil_rev_8_21_14_0_10_34_12]|nr:MAG: 50S ribosomal protein L13 [Candidatus Pacearchaeota archaeon CG10_big_fil_rev_8_21_14_0_10_34_12]